MKRYAFTMMELIFVLVVIGILVALSLPKFQANNQLVQAAEEVASRIQYTQHLAMVDDKYTPTDQTWYSTRWQIRFLSNGSTYYYDIFSDMDKGGNSDEAEEAIDPLTHDRLGTGNTMNTPTDAVNLTQKYGISGVDGTCVYNGGARKVAFDYMGRPYLNISSGVFNNPVPNVGCTIVLHHSTGNATITVATETGFVSIGY